MHPLHLDSKLLGHRWAVGLVLGVHGLTKFRGTRCVKHDQELRTLVGIEQRLEHARDDKGRARGKAGLSRKTLSDRIVGAVQEG